MNPYDLVERDGHTLDYMTDQALDVVEHLLGYHHHSLTIAKGSYVASDAHTPSAGTHAGGGAVDLTAHDADRKVLALRQVGFAAYHRLPSEGPWEEHVHAVLMGNAKLSPAAELQVRAYLAGRNALRTNLPDTGPRQFTDRRFELMPKPHTIDLHPAPKPKRTLRHPIKGVRPATGPQRRAIAKAQLTVAQNAITRAMKELDL